MEKVVFNPPYLIIERGGVKREIDVSKIRSTLELPVIDLAIRNQVIQWINQTRHQKELEQRKQILEEVESLLKESRPLPKNTEEIVEEFVKSWGKIIFEKPDPLNPTVYRVFEVSGYRFKEPWSAPYELRKIGELIKKPSADVLFEILRLKKKPGSRTLFWEQVPVRSWGENSRGSRYNVYSSEEVVKQELQKKIERVKEGFVSQEITTAFKDLVIIVYKSELRDSVKVKYESNEYKDGRGEHFCHCVVGEVVEVWNVAHYYIDDAVHEEVRKMLLEKIKNFSKEV